MKTYRKNQTSKMVALVFCLLVFTVATAPAALITFTHEGSGSGTIDGNPFSLTRFVITAVGDTTNRQVQGSAWFIDHASASIDIVGVGTYNFLTGTRTFINTSTVGFSRAGSGGGDLFNGPNAAVLSGWDMLSSIGPVAGDGFLSQWALSPVNTDQGVLLFDSAATKAVFTAKVVPEPMTLSLLGLGGLLLRKRKK